MVKKATTPGFRAAKNFRVVEEEEGEEEVEEVGGFELAMCCFVGLVVLLAFGIIVVAVSPTSMHKKISPRTRFPSNVKTKTSFEVKALTIKDVEDALLSEEALENQIIDCTRFRTSGEQSHTAVDLLVLVHSDPGASSDVRNKVRATWMSSTLPNVEVVFVVPAQGKSTAAVDKLREECSINKDMVVFKTGPQLPESEFLLLQFAWASRAKMVNFHYMLKTRDFMYVNLPGLMTNLVPELKSRRSNSYLGYFRADLKTRMKDLRKHPEPNFVLCDRFIRFAHSTAYIISSELVHRIHSQSTYLFPYNNEDIALATWLSPFNDVDWQHDIRFNTELGHSRGCRNDWLVLQTSNLLEQHRTLQESGKPCVKEWQDAKTYSFNFETPPSNCCTTVTF